MTETLKVEKRGHVLCMGFNRPEKYNAMDVDTYRALADAYGRLHNDDDLRCGLLYGEGKHFTAGLELDKWAPHFGAGGFPDIGKDAIDPFGLDPDNRVGKPVVVAMQGICFTVAIELALAADIRVAADDCRIGQIEIKRGIYPVGGATIRFIQSIGWGNSMRYLLTGDEFGAEEAYRMGLVQEVTPAGEQFDKAFELAERISKQAPLGVYATLRNARLSILEGERAAIDRLFPELKPIMESEDAKEGVQSFLERREAKFQGR